MSSKGKKKCNSDSEVYKEDYDSPSDDQESESELGVFLGKLNLGPKKKLLVMNLNGILLHRVNRRVSKRPFSEEFMSFCLERFQVGIWSSAMEHNVDVVLTRAMGSSSSKLLVKKNVQILENKKKPLFFKDLNEVFLSIKEGGPYSALNTVLVDDKPYKAFLNPPNTAIFPESYKPANKNDRALDPDGELCMYLKGLVDSLDVQTYVKDHPFGQPPITSSPPDWSFYMEVKEKISVEF